MAWQSADGAFLVEVGDADEEENFCSFKENGNAEERQLGIIRVLACSTNQREVKQT